MNRKEWYREYKRASPERKKEMRQQIQKVRVAEYGRYADEWNRKIQEG